MNLVTLLTTKPRPRGELHGERPFWRQYGAEYLAKFVAGFRRHLPCEFVPICLTDSPELVAQASRMAGVPINAELLQDPVPPGWWAKLALFAPHHYIEGKTLFSDLDNVATGDLSALVALEPDPILAMDDRIHPRRFNASTMLCYPERLRFLWETFTQDPEGWMAKYSTWPHASDQAFVWDLLRERGLEAPHYLQDLLPAGYILNSRAELERGAFWTQAAFVYGSWDPKPHMSDHPIYRQHWRL